MNYTSSLKSRRGQPANNTNTIWLPFITTSPITDTAWLLYLFPLWWILGIEQFVWSAGYFLISLKVISIQKYQIKINNALKWTALFLFFQMLSTSGIVESFRWITFIRNFNAHLAFFFIIFILINQVRSWEDIKLLLNAHVIAMLFAAIIGLLALLQLWQPQFTSLVGFFMPGWIKATSYGGAIAVRSVGQLSWFEGLNVYFRVNSFFMFATLYASALALTIPTTLFLFNISSSLFSKAIYGSIFLLFVLNIVYTTGRIAMIGCLAGGLYYMFFFSKWNKLVKLAAVFGFLIFTTAILFNDIQQLMAQLFEDFVFARGAGSFDDRSTIYRITLEQVYQRPFFGWGTERDIPDFFYPAGSHSFYLGILYRHGIFGFVSFLCLLVTLWQEITLRTKRKLVDRSLIDTRKFLQYGKWVLVAFIVNSLTDALDLDSTTMMLFGLTIGLLISAKRMLSQSLAPNV